MAWSTPKTWAAGEVVTNTGLNTEVRDNLNYLFERPFSAARLAEASTYTTTSSTFTDIDSTDGKFALSLDIQSDRVMGFVNLTLMAAGNINLDIDVDGQRLGLESGLAGRDAGSFNAALPLALPFVATGLNTGVHTFKVQWKTSNYISAFVGGVENANASAFKVHPFFAVWEF